MKILKRLLGILAVIILAIFIAGFVYLRMTVPDYEGQVTLQGISSPVELTRDSYGIPHIFARADNDAYFALGYAMAQDRLFQMEMLKRTAGGRLAEILGQDALKTDRLLRTAFSAADIQASLEAMDSRSAGPIDAYVRGVNAYIKYRREPLSFEFLLLGFKPEEWNVEDVATIILFSSWFFSTSFESDLLHASVVGKVGGEMAADLFMDSYRGLQYRSCAARISEAAFWDGSERIAPLRSSYEGGPYRGEMSRLAGTAKELLQTLHHSERTLKNIGFSHFIAGCNNFGIAGTLSGTGAPLLAHDCHTLNAVPGIMYEAHLITPNFKITGQLQVGSPVFWAGQTEHIAWVYTGAFTDDLDFYIEIIHPSNPHKYLFEGRWEDMRVKKEVTRIKGGEKEEITIRLTRHGPLIDDVIVDSLKTELPRRAIAMRWAASELTSQFKTAHNALTRSKNINKFTDTFSLWSFPSAHLIVADNNGDMAYILGSGIPVRRGFDGSLPVPGWDGKYEWQGFVPPQQKPMCRNPGMGFINTSNSRQPVPHDYPHELGNVFFPPDRAARITEVIKETLGKNGEFRPQDVNRVYSDVHVLMAKRWIPLLLEALKGAKLSGNETRALEELSRWDCLSRKEAIAPMIFQSLLMRMIENSFAHRLGKELYKEYIESHTIALKGLRNVMASERSPWFDNLDTPAIEGRAEMLKKSFREAVQYLEARLGTDVGEWKLGKLLTLTFKHPFSAQLPFLRPFIDVGPYPMSGGFIVPYQTSYKIAEPFAVEGLSTARHVLDLSDRRKAMAVTIPGISGNFMSPHYDDQVDMWYSFKFRPLMLYRDQVENDARYRMKLLPKK